MRKIILSVLVTLAVAAFVSGGCRKSQPQKPTTPPAKKSAQTPVEKQTTPPAKKTTQPPVEKQATPPVEKPTEK